MSSKFSHITNKIMTSIKLNEDNSGFKSTKDVKDEPESSKIISPRIEDTDPVKEEDLQKRNKLINLAKGTIEDSLDENDKLKKILDQIKDLTKEYDINKWVLNDEGNTASLTTKDAQIFLQNNNICLSYKNKIELFKSVNELHDWLIEHDFPIPHGICLHESSLKEENEDKVDEKNYTVDQLKELLGANFINWLKDNYPDDPRYQDLFTTNECCATTGGLGSAVSWFGNKDLKEKVLPYPNTWFYPNEDQINRSRRGYRLIQALVGNEPRPSNSTSKTMNPSIEDMKDALQWYYTDALFIRNILNKIYKGTYTRENIQNKFSNMSEDDLNILFSDSDNKLKAEVLKKYDPLGNKMQNLISQVEANPENKKDIIAKNLNTSNSFKPKDDGFIQDFINKYFPDDEELAGKVYDKLSTYWDNPKNYSPKNIQSVLKCYEYYMDMPEEEAMDKIKSVLSNVKNSHTFEQMANGLSKVTNDTVFYKEFIKPALHPENVKESTNGILSRESFKEHLRNMFNKSDEKVLTEEETPADFATGATGDNSLDINAGNTADTTSTVDTPDMSTDMDTGTTDPQNQFGDININTPSINNDYAPDTDQEQPVNIEPEKEFIIEDVLINDETGEVRIKIKNKETGETELKALSEIDV